MRGCMNHCRVFAVRNYLCAHFVPSCGPISLLPITLFFQLSMFYSAKLLLDLPFQKSVHASSGGYQDWERWTASTWMTNHPRCTGPTLHRSAITWLGAAITYWSLLASVKARRLEQQMAKASTRTANKVWSRVRLLSCRTEVYRTRRRMQLTDSKIRELPGR